MSTPPEFVEPVAGLPSDTERQWAAVAHASALLGAVLSGVWFGWGCFLGPLVIWLLKRDSLPFAGAQAREALNFNITVALISLVLTLFTLVTFGIGAFLAVPLGIVLGVAWLVYTLIATLKAQAGVAYRYPFCLRLIG
ncbi:DUF4870 domain-containing protein [Frateuria aurantia]